MNTVSFSRRGFLMSTSAAIAAAAVGQSFAASSRASKGWIIACRDGHLAQTKAPDCWAALKTIGVNAVEVDIAPNLECKYLYHPTKKYTADSPAAIAALKNDLKANGVQINSFLLHTQFDANPEASLEWCAKVVAVSKEVGAKAIRIDVVPGKLQGKPDEFLQFAIGMGKKLVDLVKDSDISFGIENHGNTTNDPKFLDALFSAVESKKLGLTLDTANFYWYGHPISKLYGFFETLAPRVVHTHCKSIRYPDDKKDIQREMGWEYDKYNCPVFEGDIDFAKVIAILKKAGYNGDLCVEDESLGKFPEAERGAILRKEAEFLRKLV